MSWNYRVMAVPHPTKGWEQVYLTINDVYYKDDGSPDSYGDLMSPPVYQLGEIPGGDSIEEISGILDRMKDATTKPILCGGDRWPQEYKP